MMVFGKSTSCKLRIVREDGSVNVLHYASREARDADKAFYQKHGFKCS